MPEKFDNDKMDEVQRIELTDELDLHAFHPRDVKPLLLDFIQNAMEKGYTRVRIAHGKGKSVIKHIVWKQLEMHKEVISFRDEPGNWGATVAQLRERK